MPQIRSAAVWTALLWMLSLQSCLSVSHSHPELLLEGGGVVLYDNDEVVDVYTDDYMMALAASGDIRLVGLITSTSSAPYNHWVTQTDYQRMVLDRAKSVDFARKKGWQHIPTPVLGTRANLVRPSSDRIEDTRPIESEGSWLVVQEARKATPEQPLLLVMGGPLTLVADAYLMDRSIADRVVVMWLGGGRNDMGGYNGWADPWAAYIVITHLRLMQFPEGAARPFIPKSRLRTELGYSPLAEWMIKKQLPGSILDLPGEHDEDGPPAIALLRKDYIQEVRHVSFSHWERIGDDADAREVPVFKQNHSGKAVVVMKASATVATEEWWRAVKMAMRVEGQLN